MVDWPARVPVLTCPQDEAIAPAPVGRRLLTDGSRTVLPRQQTLQALVDRSYGQLVAPGTVTVA